MRKKKSGIIPKLIATLCVILAIFAGGYFFLDKIIVPKYFNQYGISGVSDLVGVVTSLYKSPKETKIIKNPYTETDLNNSITKLQNSNYLISDDGTILESDYSEFKGDLPVTLTDKEFAAVCNKLIQSGILSNALPNLRYLNLLNISIREVIITPDSESLSNGAYNAANIYFIAKLDTVNIREQIATQMDTPLFLLNMIIPDNLYFSVSYDLDLTKPADERVENGTIAINGRTTVQSETLINLLVSFIFPEEEQMNLSKFTTTFGEIILRGIDILGDVEFVSNIGTAKQNGISIYVD